MNFSLHISSFYLERSCLIDYFKLKPCHWFSFVFPKSDLGYQVNFGPIPWCLLLDILTFDLRPRKRNRSSKERKQRSRTLPHGPILSYEEVLNPGNPNRGNMGTFEEISDARKVFLRSGYQPLTTEGETTEAETNFPREEEREEETTDCGRIF